MKKIYAIVLLAICSIKSIESLAEKTINIRDSLALVDLYNSTDGPHWKKHVNWLTKASVNTWYGISVSTSLDITKRVTVIDLRVNNLTGIIPVSIGNLFYLRSLLLSQNHLTGIIPSTIDSLQNLDDLFLSTNNLNGTLPANWGNLKNLLILLIDNNQLTGKIPPGIDSLSHLSILKLNNNQLSGSIPQELANCLH